jgi:hypothetical protein
MKTLILNPEHPSPYDFLNGRAAIVLTSDIEVKVGDVIEYRDDSEEDDISISHVKTRTVVRILDEPYKYCCIYTGELHNKENTIRQDVIARVSEIKIVSSSN